MYITEPCVAFGLMAKSRKEASREKKIYKINTKYTIYKQTKQRYNNNPTPPSLQKKRKERKGKERKGRGKRKKASPGIKPSTSCSLGNWLLLFHLRMNNQYL